MNAKKKIIIVQFFRFCRGSSEYIANEDDTDKIKERFIYFHLKKELIEVRAATSNREKVFKVKDENIVELLRAAQQKWIRKIAEVPE